MQCTNNQKQLGIALHNQLNSQGSFPPGIPNAAKNKWITGGTQAGAVCQGPNWLSLLSPEMENASSPQNYGVHATRLQRVGRLFPSRDGLR